MTKKTRILIVDDHVLMQEGLRSLFKPHRDFEIVGGAGTLREAVEMVHKLEPDLVLMDIELPDGDGVEATQIILAQRPGTKIVMLTMHETDELLFGALRSGAIGYLLKDTPAAKLVEALRAMDRGEAPLSRTMTKRLLNEYVRVENIQHHDFSDLKTLTPREMEVLKELASGASNQEIARRLAISLSTVKSHIHFIYRKLKLNSRDEAVKFARRHLDQNIPEGEGSHSIPPED